MSQEGAKLHQAVVEGSHDRAASTGGSAQVGATSSPRNATENNNAGSKPASPAAVDHAGEDHNAGSKLASPTVLHDGENSNVGSKPNSPTVVRAGENDNAGSKVPSPAAHPDEINAGSKPSSPTVVHVGENKNAGSKPAIAAVIDACENKNAGSKPATSAVVDAGENSNAGEGKEDVAGGQGSGDAAAGNNDNTTAQSNSKWTRSSSDGGVRHVVKLEAPEAVGAGGGSGRSKGNGAPAEVEHALHIWTERERRKKMKIMFSTLHALLPHLTDKADKATIVGEAVTYIRTLEGTIQRLEQLKQNRVRAQRLGVLGSVAPASSAGSACHGTPTREALLADAVQRWSAQQEAAAPRRGSAAVTTTPHAPFQTWSGPSVVLSVAGVDAFINVCTPRQRGVLMKALFVLEKHRIDVLTANASSDRNRSMFSIHARIINGATTARLSDQSLTAEDRFKLAVSEMLQWLAK